MANIQKPRRRRSGFMEGPDQVLRLNSLHGLELIHGKSSGALTRSAHAEFDEVSPEPLEELDDVDISDSERRSAIARERWRREGRG